MSVRRCAQINCSKPAVYHVTFARGAEGVYCPEHERLVRGTYNIAESRPLTEQERQA